MPRFVILEHDHPLLHWDLMLEYGSALRTWRLATPLLVGEAIEATAVLDHRLAYLEYEGPISGGRGRVVRRDRGTCTLHEQDQQHLVVYLEGEHFRGVLRLEQIEGSAWRCEVRVDAPSP